MHNNRGRDRSRKRRSIEYERLSKRYNSIFYFFTSETFSRMGMLRTLRRPR